MKRFTTVIILLFTIVVNSSFTKLDLITKSITKYPTPEGVNNMLFYVQRTINTNTIVYTLNLDKEGRINETEPIKAYWIKYAQDGKIDPLTFIQRNYAYGIKVKLIDNEKKSFLFEFVSYSKRKFYLMKSTVDNQYHAYGYINNKLTILNNIMVRIEGGSFWLPNVKSVEVSAKDPSSSAIITETIRP